MKIKTTYEQLQNFAVAAQTWLDKDKGNLNTKLGYAIHKLSARMQKTLQRYQNARQDIEIDTCSTDEKGIILKDERGGYRYTKDGLKERARRWQELFESECEIEPYFATQIPDDLTDIERDQLSGFVIREEAGAATE